MATYYCGVLYGDTLDTATYGMGSFSFCTIDGRLSLAKAKKIARQHAISECKFRNKKYVGFGLTKGINFNCLDKAKRYS